VCTLVFSTNKANHHDITKILLKVALSNKSVERVLLNLNVISVKINLLIIEQVSLIDPLITQIRLSWFHAIPGAQKRVQSLSPWGVHLRAILVILDTGILRTCPSHLKRLCCISLRTHVEFVISSRFSFEIRIGQKILQICLRQLWWKLDSALISEFVTLQYSLPYSRTDFTLLLYNLIVVFRLYCLDFQMGRRNLWNADLALASLF
jgi:hypothetical protein